MSVAPRDVRLMQVCYPQIYLACHTRHVRRRSSRVHLSAPDSTVMAHLDEHHPVTASRLAAHLGVSRSTLSATVKRLTVLGYIARERHASDGRVAELRLSADGARAMQESSVLDTARVTTLLSFLEADERQRAL